MLDQAKPKIPVKFEVVANPPPLPAKWMPRTEGISGALRALKIGEAIKFSETKQANRRTIHTTAIRVEAESGSKFTTRKIGDDFWVYRVA